MPTLTDIGQYIVATPGIRGGRPRIAGTGISVNCIVSCYKQGMTAEEIADEYPNLDLAHVYTALAYYHANRQAIEQDLASELSTYDQIASEAKQ